MSHFASSWSSCPDDILSAVFRNLDVKCLTGMAVINRHWGKVARDGHLWKRLFAFDFGTIARLERRLHRSWHDEYRFLRGQVPRVEVQCLREHTDEVLHVAFSLDGSMFATCSKDATVKVWTSENPVELMASKDLAAKFNWSCSSFAEFNDCSDLLLVSGGKNGGAGTTHATTNGEIIILAIDLEEGALHFQCRVVNRPSDVFGTWFDSMHLLNGELHAFESGLLQASSISQIWLCKASQDSHNERAAVLAPFYRFLNRNGGCIRSVMIGNYVSERFRAVLNVSEMAKKENKTLEAKTSELLGDDIPDGELEQRLLATNVACINCTLRHHLTQEEYGSSLQGSCLCVCHSSVQDRLLIFHTGTHGYQPHMVAFKLISSKLMLERLNGEVMTAERREAVLRRLREIRSQSASSSKSTSPEPVIEDDTQSEDDDDDQDPFDDGHHAPDMVQQLNNLMAQFDQPDHMLEMNGQIIGMALSPDHRNLYVNVRKFVEDRDMTNPLKLLKISDQVELRLIDLNAMVVRDTVYIGHQAFTAAAFCFFIFPSASEHFICSGAEDNAAYIWSKEHRCLIARLPHEAVVNAIAVNPMDEGMAITVSDDHTVRVWRSSRATGQSDWTDDCDSVNE